jgi:hypothetical protein
VLSGIGDKYFTDKVKTNDRFVVIVIIDHSMRVYAVARRLLARREQHPGRL